MFVTAKHVKCNWSILRASHKKVTSPLLELSMPHIAMSDSLELYPKVTLGTSAKLKLSVILIIGIFTMMDP